MWASCIRIVEPTELKTLALIELPEGEAGFGLMVSSTLGEPGEQFLVLGSAKNMKLHPQSCTVGYISVYRFNEDGSDLELLHKTATEDLPLAFAEYEKRLIAGIGNILRVYEIGKKKLLRKCENRNFASGITNVKVDEGRVFVTD